MTAKIRLFSGPLSMFGAKAQIAAREKGMDFELVMVPFDMERLYEPKHPEVVRINPKRQVPVLIHGDLEIFDSTQIFEYLEDLRPSPALWPADVAARAQARLLELKSDEGYFPHIIRLMGLRDTPQDSIAVGARDAGARPLLRGDGRPDPKPRVPRRPLLLCRHCLLYGAALRRPHGCAHDGGRASLAAVARPRHGAARGAPCRGPHGRLPDRQPPPDSGVSIRRCARLKAVPCVVPLGSA